MPLQEQAAKTSKYLNAEGLMSRNATTLSSCGQEQKFTRLVSKSEEMLAIQIGDGQGKVHGTE
jgi:hypothetical protein